MRYSLSSNEARLISKLRPTFKSNSFYVRVAISKSSFKVGFSVSRSFGSAVLRNKFKRKTRSFLSNSKIKNLNYHFLFSPSVPFKNWESVECDLQKLQLFVLNKKEVFCG